MFFEMTTNDDAVAKLVDAETIAMSALIINTHNLGAALFGDRGFRGVLFILGLVSLGFVTLMCCQYLGLECVC